MIVLFLAHLTASAQSSPPVCKNLLALKLMVDNDLTDCHSDVLSTGSGSTYAACNNQTANWCVDNLPAQTPTSGFGFTASFVQNTWPCADGSPAYYFKSNVANPGSPTEFIFRLNGHSGRCEARWDPETGMEAISAAQNCADEVLKDKVFTGMPLPDVPLNHVDGVISETGPFQDKIRVWIPSCSSDNYQGNKTFNNKVVSLHRCSTTKQVCTPSSGDTGDTGGADPSCPGMGETCEEELFEIDKVYTRGHAIVKDILTEVLTGVNDPKVTLVGTSGGSGGLTMILDDLAAHIRTIDPDATVIGVLDSNQEASVGAFDAYLDGAEEFTNRTVYTQAHPPVGTANRSDLPIVLSSSTPADTGGGDSGHTGDTGAIDYLSWNGMSYREPGLGRGTVSYTWLKMDALLDQSCVTHHGGNSDPCRDHEHVRNHHLSTPVLVVQSLRDRGLFGAAGKPNQVGFAVQPGVDWDMLQESNSAAVAHLQRHALYDFYAERGSAHGDALNVRRGVFAPMDPDHELTRANLPLHQLENTTQGCKTLEQVLTQWIDNTGEPVFVEGMPEGANATFDCAP